MSSTWREYISECGASICAMNCINATMTFEEKYKGNLVSWDGYYVNSWTEGDSYFSHNNHKSNIILKMQHSESKLYGDILASIPQSKWEEEKGLVEGLKVGDGVDFSGILTVMGDEWHVHHLHLTNIRKNGKYIRAIEQVVVQPRVYMGVLDHK